MANILVNTSVYLKALLEKERVKQQQENLNVSFVLPSAFLIESYLKLHLTIPLKLMKTYTYTYEYYPFIEICHRGSYFETANDNFAASYVNQKMHITSHAMKSSEDQDCRFTEFSHCSRAASYLKLD